MSIKATAFKKEYLINYSDFFGGLNLDDPPFRLPPNESPEMQNLIADHGVLRCREGQKWITDPFTPSLGRGYACYERVWNDHIFCHIGTGLYAVSVPGGSSYATPILLTSGIPAARGTFFTYHNALFYKTRGAYKKITGTYHSGSGAWTFTVANVEGFIPVILINADPTTAAGDVYQPENRISKYKTVWYTAVSGVREYHLPVKAMQVEEITVDGLVTTAWTYNPATGVVTFSFYPPVTTPPTPNTVRITYRNDNTDAENAVLSCTYASVYGGATGNLCIVLGGCEAQKNAYFWNSNTNLAMDPGYFPMENYQLAGDADETITGFGRQQSYLIVFKEHSVGRTAQGFESIDGRDYIDMAYIPINSRIGCDLPWSIQLAENNLVWANRAGGVHLLQDTSAALENNIVCISRKINPDGEMSGLLSDLAAVSDPALICSRDDDSRYYLTVNQHSWVWDYSVSTVKKPAWFFFTNQASADYTRQENAFFGMTSAGRFVRHCPGYFSDFGAPIPKVYRSKSESFGNARHVKNVNELNVILCPETASTTSLTYLTDHETRRDLTDLVCPAPTSGRPPRAFHRRPMCRHVLFFAVRLENYNLGEDMAVSSAEIYFNEQGRIR